MTTPKSKVAETAKTINWSETAKQFEGQTGFEMTNSKDFGITFLTVVQSKCKQTDRQSEKYIPDAKEGDIVSSLSNKLVHKFVDMKDAKQEDLLAIVICRRDQCLVEWAPRGSGNGIINTVLQGTPEAEQMLKRIVGKNDKGVPVTSEGNEVVETIYVSAMFEQDGEWSPCIIPLASTQIKKWQRIMEEMRHCKVNNIQLPWYGVIWGFGTGYESNTKGNWYGWSFRKLGYVETYELLDTTKKVYKETSNLALMSAAHAELTDNGENTGEVETPNVKEEDIPF